MSKKYFTNDYVKFFKDLKSNNNKEWFHSQKKRYAESVKIPFANFVSDLIEAVQKHEPEIQVLPKDCISRINRDIRFAKDKTPYNLNLNAFVSKGGKKDKSVPGLFVRLAHDMVGIMGGCYGPDKEKLGKIRQAIIDNPKEFNQLISRKAFKEKFGEIEGEKMKRIPKDLREAAEKQALILNKNFYYMASEKASLISSDKLMKTLMDHYKIMKPLNDFLTR